MSPTIRAWFCVTVAVTAAALGDPLVEFASNAGAFGAGTFTDHSYLDVLPAFGVATAFVLVQSLARVRSIFSKRLRAAGDALTLRRALALLPAAFALQIAVLFGMETLEQLAVYGHVLGGSVWLGGPVAISLAVHAACCALGTLLVVRSLRAVTRSVLRLVIFLRAFTRVQAQGETPALHARAGGTTSKQPEPLVCRIGERAPPLQLATP